MSEMFKISLPDGSVREMPQGSTPADVAAAIGPGLAKAALAARIDGELVDLSLPFTGDARRDRRLGQAGPDRRGNVSRGSAGRDFAHGTVGQADLEHRGHG